MSDETEPTFRTTLADVASELGMTAQQLLARKRPCPRSWPEDFEITGSGPTFWVPLAANANDELVEFGCSILDAWMAGHPSTSGAPIAMFLLSDGRNFILGQVRSH